jgi:MFS family permease
MHWFDLDRAIPEIARVLAPGGVLAALWNVDDDRVGWVETLAQISKGRANVTGLTGITLAATFLASVVQPGFGALTDRYRNLGWLVAAGLLVAGLGIGLSGLGDNYLITWFAVAASGVGVAAYHPEATRTARGMAGDSTQAMSWFSVGGPGGLGRRRRGPAVRLAGGQLRPAGRAGDDRRLPRGRLRAHVPAA